MSTRPQPTVTRPFRVAGSLRARPSPRDGGAPLPTPQPGLRRGTSGPGDTCCARGSRVTSLPPCAAAAQRGHPGHVGTRLCGLPSSPPPPPACGRWGTGHAPVICGAAISRGGGALAASPLLPGGHVPVQVELLYAPPRRPLAPRVMRCAVAVLLHRRRDSSPGR